MSNGLTAALMAAAELQCCGCLGARWAKPAGEPAGRLGSSRLLAFADAGVRSPGPQLRQARLPASRWIREGGHGQGRCMCRMQFRLPVRDPCHVSGLQPAMSKLARRATAAEQKAAITCKQL